MSTVEPTPDATQAPRASDPNPPRDLLQEARDRAHEAFADGGCPPWCTTPVECQRQIDAGATDVEHVGPVITIRGPRRVRADMLITVGVTAVDEPGCDEPLSPRVRLEIADLIGAEMATLAVPLDPDIAVDVATALLGAAAAARTVTR